MNTIKIATEADLLTWLSGETVDAAPHTVKEIVNASTQWLEDNHDWVQWALPTPEASKFVPWSPTLSVDGFKNLKHEQRCTILALFFKFSQFLLDNQAWMTASSDHNWNRITRAIRCMCLLNRQDEAKNLIQWCCDSTKNNPQCIVNAWHHWSNALTSVGE